MVVLGKLEIPVSKALLDSLDCLERKERLAMQDELDYLARKETQEILELTDVQDCLVPKVTLVGMVSRVLLENLAQLVTQGFLAQMDLLDRKVYLECLV